MLVYLTGPKKAVTIKAETATDTTGAKKAVPSTAGHTWFPFCGPDRGFDLSVPEAIGRG